jgi:hypothetical protein
MSVELIFEIAFVFFLGAIIGYLIISNILIRIKNKQLFVKAAQSEIDKATVYSQAQEIFKDEYEKAASNDGFIKFMSTSRDWAFQYIEDVQKDLYNLKDVFDVTGASPKTVAQANNLNEKIRKVLEHLPTEDKVKDV